jgi:uncharacterized glyoxalase superfamily protein PhnB
MPERPLADRVEQAVAEVLARLRASARRDRQLDPGLAPLIAIARELRDLPRESFKVRLKSDLERRSFMASVSAKARTPKARAGRTGSASVHERAQTVTPYLVAEDAAALIDFVKQVFGGEEVVRSIGSAGGIHCEVRVGDSSLMLGGGGPELSWRGQAWPTALHVYVPDVDAAYRRAVQAGGESSAGPVDQPYGERSADVKDAAGNHWYIATCLEGPYKPEGFDTVMPYLHPLRAEPVINFLKRAFGAEEIARYASPDGVIHHAQVRIGTSVIEMGEAHGSYQPMPTMFYVSLPDVDTSYQRALEAGATSVSEPANQPYGARGASVKDVFGNQWYLATPVK